MENPEFKILEAIAGPGNVAGGDYKLTVIGEATVGLTTPGKPKLREKEPPGLGQTIILELWFDSKEPGSPPVEKVEDAWPVENGQYKTVEVQDQNGRVLDSSAIDIAHSATAE